MSETKPLHSRNVREIRWCPTKEPVKPLGCRVTLPKTRMEPEDKPKDQERCDQDHLEGQAQRQMLDTSSSSCKSICYRSCLNRSDTDPIIDQLLIIINSYINPRYLRRPFYVQNSYPQEFKVGDEINSSRNIVRCTVFFLRCVATLVTSTGLLCSTVLMPSNSSPAMLRWLSVRQHMEGCGHVYLSCTSAYSKESRLMLQTCECHFRVVCSWWAD